MLSLDGNALSGRNAHRLGTPALRAGRGLDGYISRGARRQEADLPTPHRETRLRVRMERGDYRRAQEASPTPGWHCHLHRTSSFSGVHRVRAQARTRPTKETPSSWRRRTLGYELITRSCAGWSRFKASVSSSWRSWSRRCAGAGSVRRRCSRRGSANRTRSARVVSQTRG